MKPFKDILAGEGNTMKLISLFILITGMVSALTINLFFFIQFIFGAFLTGIYWTPPLNEDGGRK